MRILILVSAVLMLVSQACFSEGLLANEKFFEGNYKTAIPLYEEILKHDPQNTTTLKMLGISYANLDNYKKSLIIFFQVLQQNPNDVVALNGMGAGLGFLGEYHESRKYFARSLEVDSENQVTWNYLEFTNKILGKYPYEPTPSPQPKTHTIPEWIKQNALWWSEDKISNQEFFDSIKYLIEQRIIQINISPQIKDSGIPEWFKDSALWWSQGLISDDEFTNSLEYLIQIGAIELSEDLLYHIKKIQREELSQFDLYLLKIFQNIDKEKRYIEFPNPSQDVIKKFQRDYSKWNFEQQIALNNKDFTEPKIVTVNGTTFKQYKIFVNEQPTDLPLDHRSTLDHSISFWEKQNIVPQVKFSYTNSKFDANVWITWVVRNLGENVIGHAHIGKGVIEIALGDYACDGSFQLYSIDTVEKIMRHELGHIIGLGHSHDSEHIMYPIINQTYTYCLLN